MPTPRVATGGHLIARALRLEGVRNVFTIAGDHILPVLDVMSDMDFRFLDTRHEQAAVHMADAWARITGGPGVAMYTSAGFANAIPGLASALHAESPVLSVSGAAESYDLGRGAMQEIDQVAMARPVTKGSWLVPDARRIPEMVATALRTAYSGRRGPVHLTIPVDVQEQEVPEDEVAFFDAAEYRGAVPSVASPERVADAMALLHEAQRPLLIAGSAAAYARSGDALRQLIQTTRIPLMTEGDARGLVPDDHPYCMGFFDRGLNRAARLSGKADVVVLLGRKLDGNMGFGGPPVIAADARVIQVDPSAAEVGRNRGVDLGIVGDIAATVQQLADAASRRSWRDLPWLDELQAARESQAEWLDSMATPQTPMHATFVYKTVQRYLGPNDYLSFDGGDFCHFGRAFLPARAPGSWWYLPGLGMLGSALPTGLALKLAHPESRVVVFGGDGSFCFNGMEFDTAVRHNLPVVAILGNDAAWGIDRQIQLAIYGRPVATDLLPTRYDQVVAGLGGHGEHVERPDELAPAIERAFGAARPALVNVRVQRAISPRAEAAIARWKARTAPSA